MSTEPEKTVNDYPDSNLLARAVRGSRDPGRRKGERHPRWVAVQAIFGLGSTYSHQLCRRFGIDPNEQVRR